MDPPRAADPAGPTAQIPMAVAAAVRVATLAATVVAVVAVVARTVAVAVKAAKRVEYPGRSTRDAAPVVAVVVVAG
ncbi:MAG: hypothetical protein ACH36H_12870 [Candidatus Nanopelagicales bacterium]